MCECVRVCVCVYLCGCASGFTSLSLSLAISILGRRLNLCQGIVLCLLPEEVCDEAKHNQHTQSYISTKAHVCVSVSTCLVHRHTHTQTHKKRHTHTLSLSQPLLLSLARARSCCGRQTLRRFEERQECAHHVLVPIEDVSQIENHNYSHSQRHKQVQR